jgi:hypothetical protein
MMDSNEDPVRVAMGLSFFSFFCLAKPAPSAAKTFGENGGYGDAGRKHKSSPVVCRISRTGEKTDDKRGGRLRYRDSEVNAEH